MATRTNKTALIITGDATGAVRATRLTSSEIDKLNKSTRTGTTLTQQYSQRIRTLQNAFGGLVGGLAAGAIVRNISQQSDAYKNLEGRLRIVTDSELELVHARQQLFEISQRTGQAISATGDLYVRLEQSLKSLKTPQEEILRLTETINKAFVISGASAQESENAIRQLSQGLAAGALRGDEFRSVMEQAPRIVNILTESLGVTRGELRELAFSGELTSEVLVKALGGAAQEIDAEFANMPLTIERAVARLSNAWNKFIGETERAGGVITAVASGISFLADNLRTVITLLTGFAAARLLAPILTSIASAALNAARGISRFGVGLTLLNARAAAATTGVTILSRSLSLVGGPAGLAILAGGALLSFAGSARAARKETDDLDQELAQVLGKWDQMARHEIESTMEKVQARISSLADEAAALQQRIETLNSVDVRVQTGGLLPSGAAADLEKRLELAQQRIADLSSEMAQLGTKLSQVGAEGAQGAEDMAAATDDLVKALQKKLAALQTSRDALLAEADASLASGQLDSRRAEQLRTLIEQIERQIAINKARADSEKEAAASLRTAEGALNSYLKTEHAAETAQRALGVQVKALKGNREKLKLSTEALANIEAFLTSQWEEQYTVAGRRAAAERDIVEAAALQVEQLKFENEALEIAIRNHEDLAIAQLRIARGSSPELVAALQKEIEKHRQLRGTYQDQQKELDKTGAAFKGLGDSIRRGFERLDDIGAQLWKDMFSGAKSAFQSIKDLFFSFLGEMAHAALTRPILLRISAAVTGSVGANVAAAGVPGGQAGLSGGTGLLSNLFTGGLSGGGIGNFFAGLPTWLGGTSTAGGTANVAGGLFGNAQNFSNGQYGIAGLLGGLGGQALFGGQGGLGGSLGSTIGLAAGGPIGAIVGGIIGGFVGGLFGDRDPRLSLSGNPRGEGQVTQTAFGDLRGFNGAGGVGLFIGEGFANDVRERISEFDAAIAGFLTEDQIADVTARLATWTDTWTGTSLTLENILGSRFEVILSAFSADVRSFVNSADDLESRVQNLNVALGIERLLDQFADLFGDRTFSDVVAAAESVKQAGETMESALERLVQRMQAAVGALSALDAFTSADFVADIDAAIAGSLRPATETLRLMSEEIGTMTQSFDGSLESLLALTEGVGVFGNAAVDALNQIRQVQAFVGNGNSALRDRILQAQLGDEGFYNILRARSRSLFGQLGTATDSDEIRRLVEQIRSVESQAAGLLTPEQLAAMGEGFLSYDEEVTSLAQQRLAAIQSTVEDIITRTQDEVRDILDHIGDPLEIAAGRLIEAAGSISDAADRLAPPEPGRGPVTPNPNDPGAYSPYYRPGQGTPYYRPGGSSTNDQFADNLARNISFAIGDTSKNTVNAIREGFRNVQIQVVVPRAALQND